MLLRPCRQVRKIRDELVQRYEEMQVEKTQFDALKAMVADMENELVREQLKVRALEGQFCFFKAEAVVSIGRVINLDFELPTQVKTFPINISGIFENTGF